MTSHVDHLRCLEESLWRPETHFERTHMEATLAPDFIEFGRSGRIWERVDCIDHEPVAFSARMPLPEFAVRPIAPDVALVTYVNEATFGDTIERARRSSLWTRTAGPWMIRFHQGTPIA